ncbi:MAG: hypothetical protein IMY73_01655 [Bacteroidetes bacterium]|nr:hypothetical protein [Bacteroidota bacterium]
MSNVSNKINNFINKSKNVSFINDNKLKIKEIRSYVKKRGYKPSFNNKDSQQNVFRGGLINSEMYEYSTKLEYDIEQERLKKIQKRFEKIENLQSGELYDIVRKKEQGKQELENKDSDDYKVRENNQPIKDGGISPCFGVECFAECFIKQLDSISTEQHNNVCMVGIFASWGRGKSYFFNKIKEQLNSRKKRRSISLIFNKIKKNKEEKDISINYDIVEFNAWKYQQSPAIWAYLFETIYNTKSRWFKFGYTFCRNFLSILKDFIIIFLPLIFTFIFKREQNYIIGSSVLGVVGFLWFVVKEHYNSAISLIRKYSKGISFSNEMGIQAEIEKELSKLLEFWIDEKTKNKKIILYVDDIDRCPEDKMISIIDSLRTILENEEIRKRLIVICSIDKEKLISGIKVKYHKNNIGEQKKGEKKYYKKIARDQMDKLFLIGIALPPINKEQQNEFLFKIMEKENSIYSLKTNGVLKIDKKTNEVFIEKDSYREVRDIQLLYNLIGKFIRESKIDLTPRQIRIIYYRVLFANNIIASQGEMFIKKSIAKYIFDMSIGVKVEMKDDEAFADIVKMVVPY